MEGKNQYKKGLWTEEEDRVLLDYVRIHGRGQWNRIPKLTGLKRCGKSCRLRWLNYLSPNVKRGDFSQEEDDLIIRLHNLLGNRWSLIAGRVPGRTDNQVKNHWNTRLCKKKLHLGASASANNNLGLAHASHHIQKPHNRSSKRRHSSQILVDQRRLMISSAAGASTRDNNNNNNNSSSTKIGGSGGDLKATAAGAVAAGNMWNQNLLQSCEATEAAGNYEVDVDEAQWNMGNCLQSLFYNNVVDHSYLHSSAGPAASNDFLDAFSLDLIWKGF